MRRRHSFRRLKAEVLQRKKKQFIEAIKAGEFDKLRHPGQVILQTCLKPNNLSIAEASNLLELTYERLSDIIDGKDNIDPKIAIKIEEVFGGNAIEWWAMQTDYNLFKKLEEEQLDNERK